ncbi:MAG: hypothetical protein ACQGQO_02430 [Sphaerochaetaceae bacterium]
MIFSFGIYSQLPNGTQNSVLERLLSRTVTPLLQRLYRKTDEKITFVLSGYEMEWIESNHPEINVLINSLSRRGQIDFLSSSFNGLCLQMLPPSERASEIERTSTFIRRRYSKRPSGFWAFQQIWNSSFLSAMNLCSLNYAVISTSLNLQNSKASKEPFIMNELDKTALIIPTDDDISRLVLEGFEQHRTNEEFENELSKLRFSRNGIVDYAMINMDQLLYDDFDGSRAISAILDCYESHQFIPKLIDSRSIIHNEILDKSFLPSGIYGFDFKTPFTSPNEVILANRQYRTVFQLFEKYKSLVRLSGADKTAKKEINAILSRAMSSYPFLFESDGIIKRNIIEKGLFEVHNLFEAKEIELPNELDIDDDSYDELIYRGDEFCGIFDSKGGGFASLLTSLNTPCFKTSSSNLLFSDCFTTKNGKKLPLCKKRFSISFLDKKCTIIEARLPKIGIDGLCISLAKNFSLSSNGIDLKISIRNESASRAAFKYSLMLPIACQMESFDEKNGKAVFSSIFKGDTEKKFVLECNSTDGPFSITFHEQEGLIHTPVEDIEKYLYTDYEIQCDIQIGNNGVFEQEFHFSYTEK